MFGIDEVLQLEEMNIKQKKQQLQKREQDIILKMNHISSRIKELEAQRKQIEERVIMTKRMKRNKN